MKTTLLLVFSLLTFSVFGQYGSPPPPPPDDQNMSDTWGSRYFHFGLNFTPGIYWVSPNTSNNSANGASFGYGYGANLEFYFTRNYGILTGFEINQMGAKYINTTSNPRPVVIDSTIIHDETLQYLQIPLELKLKTSPFGRIRYYGLVGLDFGFLLKATDHYNAMDIPYNGGPPGYPVILYSANDADIYSQTDFFRVSFVIGLGAEYTLGGTTVLQASITYNNCFTNMNNTSSSAVNIKGIELMLGILF